MDQTTEAVVKEEQQAQPDLQTTTTLSTDQKEAEVPKVDFKTWSWVTDVFLMYDCRFISDKISNKLLKSKHKLSKFFTNLFTFYLLNT